jgi:hypothetical protein
VLAIGVQQPGGMLRGLERVGTDLAHVTRLFRALGYRRGPLLRNPTAATLRERLGVWLDEARLDSADQLVIYYTGHGCVAEGNHYLCPAGFDQDRLATTAVGSAELVGLVLRRTCRPGHLWVILDCCQAGGVITGALLHGLDAPGSATFLLAASSTWGDTADGSLAGALIDVVGAARRRRKRGAAVSLDEITGAINVARGGHPAIQASLSSTRFDLLEPARDWTRTRPGESVLENGTRTEETTRSVRSASSLGRRSARFAARPSQSHAGRRAGTEIA